MTPGEALKTIIDLGICFQIKYTHPTTDEPKEDWSKAGFNAEKEGNADKEQNYYNNLSIVTDADKLWAYSQWIMALEPPKSITNKLDGPMMTVLVDKKRRLVIRGDDIPFGSGAMVLKFQCEHITHIELKKSLLVITTVFGQTGIMVPRDGV